MAKGDVGPIGELEMEIGRFAGEELKQKVMEGSEGIAKAPGKEAARWLKGAMEKMDELLGEETKTQIMESCGRNCAEMNKSHIERMVARRKKFETLEEFLKAEEQKSTKGTRLEREGDIIYQYYTPPFGLQTEVLLQPVARPER